MIITTIISGEYTLRNVFFVIVMVAHPDPHSTQSQNDAEIHGRSGIGRVLCTSVIRTQAQTLLSVKDHKVVYVVITTALAAAPLFRRREIGANFGAAHPHTRSARRQLTQLSRQRVDALDVAGALQRRKAPSDRARPDAARVLAQRLVVALR